MDGLVERLLQAEAQQHLALRRDALAEEVLAHLFALPGSEHSPRDVNAPWARALLDVYPQEHLPPALAAGRRERQGHRRLMADGARHVERQRRRSELVLQNGTDGLLAVRGQASPKRRPTSQEGRPLPRAHAHGRVELLQIQLQQGLELLAALQGSSLPTLRQQHRLESLVAEQIGLG
eukprot:scaffold5532_cov263-Pinguiococcus_pyrenoidosus.AAC.3